MATTTLTLRLADETRAGLDALARQTGRSTSLLVGEAITAYVARELTIVQEIERGLADMQAERVVPHDDVMAEIDELIEAAEAARRRS